MTWSAPIQNPLFPNRNSLITSLAPLDVLDPVYNHRLRWATYARLIHNFDLWSLLPLAATRPLLSLASPATLEQPLTFQFTIPLQQCRKSLRPHLRMQQTTDTRRHHIRLMGPCSSTQNASLPMNTLGRAKMRYLNDRKCDLLSQTPGRRLRLLMTWQIIPR